MAEAPLAAFESPAQHVAMSEIIRRHSTNTTDVREAALAGLQLASVRDILDLGCGFGFMTEAVARRVAPTAHVVGVDACASNEQAYLDGLAASGRSGEFVCRRIERGLDWPDHCFDLVMASYTLYFFPDVVPEVARVLRPEGLFVATTHTEASCNELARLIGLPQADSRLLALVRQFSAESGSARLLPWFGQVERIDYANTLLFDAGDECELLAYLRFKLTYLAPDLRSGGELAAALARPTHLLPTQGRIVLDKGDAIFRCRQPRCR